MECHVCLDVYSEHPEVSGHLGRLCVVLNEQRFINAEQWERGDIRILEVLDGVCIFPVSFLSGTRYTYFLGYIEK